MTTKWLILSALALFVIVVVALIIIVRRRRNPWYLLRRTLKKIGKAIERNRLVPDGMGGQMQVDYLVLTARGILVLETRHAPGVVFGGDQMTEWAVLGPDGRVGMRNPQEPLYDRLAAVRSLVSGAPVNGYVVFTQHSDFPKGVPSHVIMLGELEKNYGDSGNVGSDRLLESFFPYWQKLLDATEKLN